MAERTQTVSRVEDIVRPDLYEAVRQVGTAGLASPVEVLLKIVRGDLHTQLAEVDDWGDCRCRLHRAVRCAIPGAAGCGAKHHGKLPMLAALYEQGPRRFCHATEATRRHDQQFAMVACDLSVERAAYARDADVALGGFAHGMLTKAEDWGAGYCYMMGIRAPYRMTSGRVLGPDPLVSDLICVLRVAGVRSACKMEVVVIDTGGVVSLHVRKKKGGGVSDTAGAELVSDLLTAWYEYYPRQSVRVGRFDEEEEDDGDILAGDVMEDSGQGLAWLGPVERAMRFLESHGVEYGASEEAMSDLNIAACSLYGLADNDERARHKLLSKLGGASVLRLACVAVMYYRGDVSRVAELERGVLGVAGLSEVANQSGWMHVVRAAPDRSIPAGTPSSDCASLRALFGAVSLHAGESSLRLLCDGLGVDLK